MKVTCYACGTEFEGSFAGPNPCPNCPTLTTPELAAFEFPSTKDQQIAQLTRDCETLRQRAEYSEEVLARSMEDGVCIHCDQSVSDKDHWRGCAKHPATSEFAKAKADLDTALARAEAAESDNAALGSYKVRCTACSGTGKHHRASEYYDSEEICDWCKGSTVVELKTKFNEAAPGSALLAQLIELRARDKQRWERICTLDAALTDVEADLAASNARNERLIKILRNSVGYIDEANVRDDIGKLVEEIIASAAQVSPQQGEAAR